MNEADLQSEQWDLVIKPQTGLFEINLKELWSYKDLLGLLVRRDFVATYKQTILGPIWFFLAPIMTTITFVFIFGGIAHLSPDGIPTPVFYLAGITMWGYFSESLTKTATVFKDNASIFGKVYFPRLVMPLSIVVSNLVKLTIQFILFLIVWGFFFAQGRVHPNMYVLLVPVLVVLLGLMALGIGMLISALTTKYRDLAMLLTLCIQLLMYATPIIMSYASVLQNRPKYKIIFIVNPMTSIVETFRYAFLGPEGGTLNWGMLAYTTVFTLIMLLAGALVFNKVEKSFMDTV